MNEICGILYDISIYIYICSMKNSDRVKYQKDRIYAHSEKCLNEGTVLYRSLISLSHTMKTVIENKRYISVSCLLSRST